MTWFLIALINPLCAAISNLIDTHLISKHGEDIGIGGLLVFSSLTAVLTLPFLYWYFPGVLTISLMSMLALMACGGLLMFGIWCYFLALNEEETFVVASLLQSVPVWNLLFGTVFLSEFLQRYEIVGAGVLLLGAVLMTAPQKTGFSIRPLLFATLASLFFALSDVVFKVFALADFWTGQFWMSTGMVCFGVLFLLFSPVSRRGFLSAFSWKKKGVLGLNIGNELITLAGILAYNFALLIAPIALVASVAGFQPVFTLVFGVLLVFLFRSSAQTIPSRTLWGQYTAGLICIVFGGFLMNGYFL